MEGGRMSSMKHIVLVHGLGHGAWSWYKVSPVLRKAGHHVTTLDLSASGIHPKQLHEVDNFEGYSQPLLDLLGSLPPGERVILVGHSLGGMNIALAMDRFPERIAAGVFVTAFMPDTTSPPSSVIIKPPTATPEDESSRAWWMDTQFRFDDGPEQPATSILFGPKFLASKVYQHCSPEDLSLATTLVRVGPLFLEELSSKQPFSKERYGSVRHVFIVCCQDAIIVEEHQRWMISNQPSTDVKKIERADHMPMLSTPEDLCQCLLEVAESYA